MNKPPGVHGGHQHEGGGVGEAGGRPHDGHLPVLQGLAQHLQNVLLEFGKLVEEEDAVVGEAHLSGARIGAAADESGVRNGVMGVTKRAPADEGLALGEKADDGVDLRRLQGLGEAHGGEDRRQAPGEHRLAAAGGACHQEIVPAGGRHLHGALDVLLPAHLCEVFPAGAVRVGEGGGGGAARLDLAGAVEKIDDLAEVPDPVDRHALDDAPLGGVLLGEEESFHGPPAGGHGHGQNAAHRLDAPVEGELPHHDVASGALAGDDAGGGQKPHGHGKVEGGAVLADVGGRQVDGDAAGGKFVAGVLDGRFDPVLALLDRPLGEPHRGKLGQALSDVDLHLHGIGLHPDQRPRKHLRQHLPPPLSNRSGPTLPDTSPP